MTVIVAYASAHSQMEKTLQVEENCSVALAIQRSGLLQQFTEILPGRSAVGIYGKRAAWDDRLQDGDRVEIYRPLQRDPKQARLIRAQIHADARINERSK